MKTETRRNLFKKAGVILSGSLLMSQAPTETPENLTELLLEPDLLRMQSENLKFKDEIIDAAESFMPIKVPSLNQRNERSEKEEQLFQELENNNASPADILFALQAAGTIQGRGFGMQLLWNQRQEEQLLNYRAYPLDKKRIEWAIGQKIDPRILAIARESVYPASQLLKQAPDLFFEAVPEATRHTLQVEDTLPNPGVVAKLMMTETGYENIFNPDPLNQFWGLVFVGGGSAWEELNLHRDWFPQGKKHLQAIAEELQRQTGLPYLDNVKTIPGSERGDPELNGSGGAIGPQFMPINWLLFDGWYREANRRLDNKYPDPNPFEPYTSTIMCYLFLASEFYGRHGDLDNRLEYIRPGYQAFSSDERKIQALQKWNPTYQARTALAAGYDYYEKFGRI